MLDNNVAARLEPYFTRKNRLYILGYTVTLKQRKLALVERDIFHHFRRSPLDVVQRLFIDNR